MVHSRSTGSCDKKEDKLSDLQKRVTDFVIKPSIHVENYDSAASPRKKDQANSPKSENIDRNLLSNNSSNRRDFTS